MRHFITITTLCCLTMSCGGGTSANSQTTPNDSGTATSSLGGGTTAQSSSAGNTLSGSVDSITFTPAAAAYAVGTFNGLNLLILSISNQANICDLITQHASAPNSADITAVFANTDGSGDSLPAAAGTYNVTNGNDTNIVSPNVEAVFFAEDGSCQQRITNNDPVGQSGSFVITSTDLSGSAPLQGTFNMVVGSGATLQGTFNAQPCAGILTQAENSAAKTCN